MCYYVDVPVLINGAVEQKAKLSLHMRISRCAEQRPGDAPESSAMVGCNGYSQRTLCPSGGGLCGPEFDKSERKWIAEASVQRASCLQTA